MLAFTGTVIVCSQLLLIENIELGAADTMNVYCAVSDHPKVFCDTKAI